MRVAVTGATGLVGRRLCAALAKRGDEVVVLTRSPERDHGLPAFATRRFSTTAVDPDALADVDACVHLAGESVQGRWTESKKRAIRQSRVDGTRGLVDALAAAREGSAAGGPRTLVSASAIGWYGERGDQLLREDAPAGSDFLAEVCQAWEAEAARGVAHGLRVVRLRLGLVLAPEGGALAEMKLPFKLGLGGPIGSGQQWWSWIHVDDLIALFLRALDDEDLSGPLNATAPAPQRQKDFAKVLAGALGRPAFLPAPRFAVKLALGEFSTELLTSKRVLPAAAERAGFTFRFPELKGALEDLL